MKSAPPLDMLRKCRRRFEEIREYEVGQREGDNRARLAQEFIDKIDATLRDWA